MSLSKATQVFASINVIAVLETWVLTGNGKGINMFMS